MTTSWFNSISFFSSPIHRVIHPDQFSFCQFGQRMKLSAHCSRRPNNINTACLDFNISGPFEILIQTAEEYYGLVQSSSWNMSHSFSSQSFCAWHSRDLLSLWSRCCRNTSLHCSGILIKSISPVDRTSISNIYVQTIFPLHSWVLMNWDWLVVNDLPSDL